MFTARINPFPLGLICLLLNLTPVMAEETPLTFDRVRLTANASTQVENDNLSAKLYAQREGNDLSQLADEVNRTLTQAIAQVKQVPGIELQTQGYQTYPVYQQQRLSGWRVRQSIRIQSQDGAKLSQLLSKLQSSLALESLQYSISPEQREAAEEQLIGQAISAFQRRAELITKQLGRSDFRLVEMSINTSDEPVQPVRLRAGVMAMEAAVAPPSLEAGSQTIRVVVNGTIELLIDQ